MAETGTEPVLDPIDSFVIPPEDAAHGTLFWIIDQKQRSKGNHIQIAG